MAAKKDKQPTLADVTLRSMQYTFESEPPFVVDPALRNDLLYARRFVLNNEASAFMADLSYANYRTKKTAKGVMYAPDMHTVRAVKNVLSLARLPHRRTWIEYEVLAFNARESELVGTDPKEKPTIDRMGWLLRQHDHIDTAFRGTFIIGHRDNLYANQQSLDVVWTTDDTPLPWKTTVLMDAPTTEALSFADKMKNMGQFWTGLGRVDQNVALTRNGMTPFDRAKMVYQGSGPQMMFAAGAETRSILVLLATINDIPMGVKLVEPAHGYMSKHGYRKFLTHSVITLNLPKGRDPQKVARAIIAISRRRAHQVRGHWRRDWRHEGLKIWIAEHQRGDASLGFVTHDYTVTHDKH